ncbi:MAG TPA: hypothetical protein VFF78_05215 [Anaerolineaceae bacterium]|nr:hypothetical protein [Anaerolineaceae bacterium]
MNHRLIQAYKQAPWRVQLQRIGMFLLGLVGLALVAGLYLDVTAEAASAGLQVQKLSMEQDDLQRTIDDQNSRLASLTSAAVMRERAAGLGFVFPDQVDPLYVVVPGYAGRQQMDLAPKYSSSSIEKPLLKPVYTESLYDLLFGGAGGSDLNPPTP